MTLCFQTSPVPGVARVTSCTELSGIPTDPGACTADGASPRVPAAQRGEEVAEGDLEGTAMQQTVLSFYTLYPAPGYAQCVLWRGKAFCWGLRYWEKLPFWSEMLSLKDSLPAERWKTARVEQPGVAGEPREASGLHPLIKQPGKVEKLGGNGLFSS